MTDSAHDNPAYVKPASVWVVDRTYLDEQIEVVAAFTSEPDADAFMVAQSDEDGSVWGATKVPFDAR